MHPQPYDLLITGAQVIDGTGAPRRREDVAVRDDTIVAVGDLSQSAAGRTLDGTGLVLSPGFIDMHTHSDRTLLVDPGADSKVRQGVTTELIGNCGSSPTPCLGIIADEENELFARYGMTRAWTSMGEYLAALEDRGLGINVAALVGHRPIRKVAMGGSLMRAPTVDETATMQRLVHEALDQGAVGLSTGLIYPPSSYSDTDEIVAVSKEVGASGRIYASHIRNEGLRLEAAVDEAIEVGRRTGARVQISHHKASDPRVWGLVQTTLATIDRANQGGTEVDFDQYPYRASSTNLAARLPQWTHEGGFRAMADRLRDADQRARILCEMSDGSGGGIGGGITWDDVLIANCRGDRTLDGKTVGQIARERGADPAATALDILLTSGCEVGAIFFSMSEDDIRTVMRHPRMMVGSDSSSVVIGGKTQEGKPHPRAYGTFVRILGHYARDEGVLTLEEAIHKMSGAPAAKLRLADRGRVAVGMKADLVLLNPATVRETATFEQPHQYPEGIELVVVNGRITIERGEQTGALAGRVLRA
ncbi:MAG: D-aminoacylase [Chloroflexota bacterium]